MNAPGFRQSFDERFAALLLVAFSLAISVVFSVIYRCAGPYAAATAVYAIKTNDTGTLMNALESPAYWKSSLFVEAVYPAPSILLSAFTLLTGLPREYAMFNPVMPLANLVYFVMAKRILRSAGTVAHAMLFSALFYTFLTCDAISYGGNYVGRATLGEVLFAFFLLAYMFYIDDHRSRKNRGSWLAVLLVFTLAVGETYYTMTLAIAVLGVLMAVVLGTVAFLSNTRWGHKGLAVAILAMVLFGGNAYASSLMSGLSFSALLSNLIERTLILVGAQAPPSLFRNTDLLRVDFFTTLTGSWIVTMIKLISMATVAYVLLRYRPKKSALGSTGFATIWLFALAIILSNFSEFAYLFFGPVSPIRTLVNYAPITMFFFFGVYLGRNKHGTADGTKAPGNLFALQKRVVLAVILIAVLLGAMGSLRFAWYYGVGKPYAYQEVDAVSHYLLSHSSPENPVVITGDTYYTANIFFIGALHGDLDRVVAEPLLKDATTLYWSLHSGNMAPFRDSMRERGIACLLLVQGRTAVWGDGWGPAVTLPSTGALEASMPTIYDDGHSRLFCSTVPPS